MIEFEIMESPDSDVIGHYRLHKNEIYLGQVLTDINIKDPLILNSHAFMEVLEDKFLFHPQRDIGHYHLNGKRALTIRKLKIGDVVQIGQTKIKILAYQHKTYPSRKEILDQKLAGFIAAQDPRLEVIEMLGQMMK